MNINGKSIADGILSSLSPQIQTLKEKGIIPTLAVILVGDNPSSLSYVRQKKIAAERIGAKLRVRSYELGVTKDTIQKQINTLNADPSIHGVIIQRPLPKYLNDADILLSVNPKKDVDGFVPHSPYQAPVAMAVERILRKIYDKKQFVLWLNKQHIVIIGRGETAGGPIAKHFENLQVAYSVIHSQTKKEEKIKLLKRADIIISCVGKQHIITKDDVKKGVILLAVGITKDQGGTLHGDYEEDGMKDIASFYTPTPGGIGPVNVACLMQNLTHAASST